MSPFLILSILVFTSPTTVDDVGSGIKGDDEVVNDRLAAPDDRSATGAGNGTNANSGFRRDIRDNRSAVIDDRLAIGDNGLAVDNDGLNAKIDKITDMDDRSDA